MNELETKEIQIGDEVEIFFENVERFKGIVRHMPVATGDSWIIEDKLSMNVNEKDALGARMKEQYENRTRYYVPRRTHTIIRLDQKCGHTYTKNLDRPFDKGYIEDMDNAIIAMLPPYTRGDLCLHPV